MLRVVLAAVIAVSVPAMGTAEDKGPLASIVCAPTGEMTRKLTQVYGNELRAWGVQAPEQIMQVWASDKGKWTLVINYATGLSCIVAMGDNWETLQTENPV